MIRLLKIALVLLGVPVFILSVLGLFWLANNPANPSYAYMLYPILVGIYLSTIPFYIALYQAFNVKVGLNFPVLVGLDFPVSSHYSKPTAPTRRRSFMR